MRSVSVRDDPKRICENKMAFSRRQKISHKQPIIWNMNMKTHSILALVLIPLTIGLSSCGGGPREDMGTVVGAVAGGAIGNQFGKGEGKAAATIAGYLDWRDCW